jgi:hypothetical protein
MGRDTRNNLKYAEVYRDMEGLKSPLENDMDLAHLESLR